MRKSLAVTLMAVVALAAPSQVVAAVTSAGQQQAAGTLTGVARSANQAAMPNYRLQARNVTTGQVSGTTTSGQTGAFSFTGLQPASYVVEIVDATGRVVGISAPVPVVAGAMATVAVTAAPAGAMAAAAGGGFGLLGLGAVASVAVIGAAGAAIAVVAVKSTNADASPSR